MAKSTNKKNIEEWVTEIKMSEILGIKPRTLQNYVATGKVQESAISRGLKNNRFYHAPTLMGLENN